MEVHTRHFHEQTSCLVREHCITHPLPQIDATSPNGTTSSAAGNSSAVAPVVVDEPIQTQLGSPERGTPTCTVIRVAQWAPDH